MKTLIKDKPEFFTTPLTLVVTVDTSPCGKALKETVWWRHWQQAATDAGFGFVFATSRADSADLALAIQLDSVDAPILVVPSCEYRLSELGVAGGTLPLKALVDSEGTVHYVRFPVLDAVESNIFMNVIGSLGQASDEESIHH